MLPFMPLIISSRLGRGFLLSSAVPLMIIPEVQYAHCIASALMKASCSACNCPSFSRPSMVVICLPEARPTCVIHERAGWPSRSTVHAPHCPSPQPYLLPVRLRSLRNTLSRLAVESTSVVIFFPLTLSVVTLAIRTSGAFDFREPCLIGAVSITPPLRVWENDG